MPSAKSATLARWNSCTDGAVTADRWEEARVERRSRHRRRIEALDRFFEGDAQRDQPPPELGHVRSEAGADRLADPAAPNLDPACHEDVAELLGKALNMPSYERKLVVHPDIGDTAHLLLFEEAVEHAIRLVILPHGGIVADAGIAICG